RGYDVWLGDDSGNEVDFVCKRGDETIYIQATTRLTDEKVVEREFGNMSGIRDNHPKYVVTFEKTPLDSDMDGIKCVLLEDFLKNGGR
ncbi:MAG: ATPase, partial [archaeon]|nr:ATPase [archaeon]